MFNVKKWLPQIIAGSIVILCLLGSRINAGKTGSSETVSSFFFWLAMEILVVMGIFTVIRVLDEKHKVLGKEVTKERREKILKDAKKRWEHFHFPDEDIKAYAAASFSDYFPEEEISDLRRYESYDEWILGNRNRVWFRCYLSAFTEPRIACDEKAQEDIVVQHMKEVTGKASAIGYNLLGYLDKLNSDKTLACNFTSMTYSELAKWVNEREGRPVIPIPSGYEVGGESHPMEEVEKRFAAAWEGPRRPEWVKAIEETKVDEVEAEESGGEIQPAAEAEKEESQSQAEAEKEESQLPAEAEKEESQSSVEAEEIKENRQ